MNDFTKEELELLELSLSHSINFHNSCNLPFLVAKQTKLKKKIRELIEKAED